MARLARRLVRDPSDAEDLLQDALVRILRHPTGPRDDECFRAWCYGLLRNAAADFRRSAARRCRADHVGLDKLQDQADGTTADPEADLDARLAVAQSETLDQHDRELLMRRYMLEQTAAEIAQEFESTPPAIRMKLKRILTKLRGMFVLLPLLGEGSDSAARGSQPSLGPGVPAECWPQSAFLGAEAVRPLQV